MYVHACSYNVVLLTTVGHIFASSIYYSLFMQVQACQCYPNLTVGQHVLVGGKKFATVKVDELHSILHSQFQGTDVPAASCRSLLMCTQAKTSGELFRADEHITEESDLGEQVI